MNKSPTILALGHGEAAPPLPLAPGLGLTRGRAHEMTGPARRILALLAARGTEGTVIWLRPRWWAERLMGDGIAPLVDPGRLVIGRCRAAVDTLWCAEEALRSGAVPLVVAEMEAPPGLTPVRRLHLAAEAGAAEAGAARARARQDRAGKDGAGAHGTAPLCLILTPEEGGAPGVESRWHAAPLPGWAVDGRPRWRIARHRDRTAPPGAWALRLDRGRPALSPLPEERAAAVRA